MAWKPKEAPLTLEEATELAKKDLAPIWFGSEPLFAVIPADKKTIAYPLGPKFASNPWILLFFDPTDFNSESALLLAREWKHRYTPHGLDTLLCYCPKFQAMRRPECLAQFLKKLNHPFVSVLDDKGLISKAFSIKDFPRALLLSDSQVLADIGGTIPLENLDVTIQSFLRKKDPGLSLHPVIKNFPHGKRDLLRIDFGDPKLYPTPGFKPTESGVMVARFPVTPSLIESNKDFSLSGTWAKAGERIITSDPNATINIKTDATLVSWIAQGTNSENNKAEMSIELDGVPPFEENLGLDLHLAEDGRARTWIQEAKVYQLLVHLPQKVREITFRFPTANHAAIELYGIRLGKG